MNKIYKKPILYSILSIIVAALISFIIVLGGGGFDFSVFNDSYYLGGMKRLMSSLLNIIFWLVIFISIIIFFIKLFRRKPIKIFLLKTIIFLLIFGFFTVIFINYLKIKCSLVGKMYASNVGGHGESFCYTPSGHQGEPCRSSADCGIGWCVYDCDWESAKDAKCQDILSGCYQEVFPPEKDCGPFGLGCAGIHDEGAVYNP